MLFLKLRVVGNIHSKIRNYRSTANLLSQSSSSMSVINAHLWNSYSPSGVSTNNFLVLENKEQLNGFQLGSDLATTLQLTADSEVDMVKKVAETLSSGTDSAGTVEFLLPSVAESGVLRRFVLILLPTACSRHNTPAKPHALGNAVKGSKNSNDLKVILVSSSVSNAYAQALAVGRQFPIYSLKSNAGTVPNVDIVIHLPSADGVDGTKLTQSIFHTIENIRLAQRLVDMPPNLLHSNTYVEEARKLSVRLGVKFTVIQGHDLEAQGFGGLWGVGKASDNLPALVILSHIPEGSEGEKSICLVGKGIVYDTGGLSIKTPTTSMAGMKVDMGGSAAVLCGFATAVSTGVAKGPLHALLCIAENSVGPLATRPDDVHVMLSGKTVEVNNTDAEGRLVLADGVFYAHKELNPRVIVDIATLTGAQLIATGKNHAALYTNDEGLETLAVNAGKYSGDLTFPIPYVPEFYRKEFTSQVADMKNSVADRGNAQPSCAGQFIGNHLEEYFKVDGKWLHIDMAGPVEVGGRATGYGVGLLYRIVADLQ